MAIGIIATRAAADGLGSVKMGRLRMPFDSTVVKLTTGCLWQLR